MNNTFYGASAAINQNLANDIVEAITLSFDGSMKGRCKEFGVLYTAIAKIINPESKAYPVASQDPEQAGTELFDHIAVQVPGAPQVYDRTGALNTQLAVLPDPQSQAKVNEMVNGDATLQGRLDQVLGLLKAKYPQLSHITTHDVLTTFQAIVTAGSTANVNAGVDLYTGQTIAYKMAA